MAPRRAGVFLPSAADLATMRAVVCAPARVKDADLRKFLALARGDMERAVNYYLDSPIGKLAKPDTDAAWEGGAGQSAAPPAAPADVEDLDDEEDVTEQVAAPGDDERCAPAVEPHPPPPARSGDIGTYEVASHANDNEALARRPVPPDRGPSAGLGVAGPSRGQQDGTEPEEEEDGRPGKRARHEPTPPDAAVWEAGAAPYSIIASTFDALRATSSRLDKELLLAEALASLLRKRCPVEEVTAACYLLAPAKDPRAGGHRLLPDWEEGDVLGVSARSITSAISEATATSSAALRAALDRTHDLGDAAAALAQGSATRQRFLTGPPSRLTICGVHRGLLAIGAVGPGAGAEARRRAAVSRLLRAARSASEMRWLVRTLIPNMNVGVSLEAKVLPALGAATASLLGVGEKARAKTADACRRQFVLCPRVDRVVDALADAVHAAVDAADATDTHADAAQASRRRGVAALEEFSQRVRAADGTGIVTVGVPPMPMLGRPATSATDFVRRLAGQAPDLGLAVEFKYDGQRAQAHLLPSSQAAAGGRREWRLFSRKLDCITAKYPDVCAALSAAVGEHVDSCIVDCEVVPVDDEGGESGVGDEGDGRAGAGPKYLAFQALSTRKRSATAEGDDSRRVAVETVVFDMLALNGASLLGAPLVERRERLRSAFPNLTPSHPSPIPPGGSGGEGGEGGDGGVQRPVSKGVHLATSVTITHAHGDGEEAAVRLVEACLEAAVNGSCEGLMGKRLDSMYEPGGVARSVAWCKLKKDYLDEFGDSLDLVPVGGWRGSGRKRKWVSPWLLACFDPASGVFQSVCRVMSGFSDAFYQEHTAAYLGVRDLSDLPRPGDGAHDNDDDDDGDGDRGSGGGRLVACRPDQVDTGEACRFWFGVDAPIEVWEVRGSELSVSPVHAGARGLVHPERGLSLRFPRFVRKRPDKGLGDVTTPAQLQSLYENQVRRQRAPSGAAPGRGGGRAHPAAAAAEAPIETDHTSSEAQADDHASAPA